MVKLAKVGGALGLLVVVMLLGAGFIANSIIGGVDTPSEVVVTKVWSVEKYFVNPWGMNSGSPLTLTTNQIQSSVYADSNPILVPADPALAGVRVDYIITYVDGGYFESGGNDAKVTVDFNGINIVTTYFNPGSQGESLTGQKIVPLNLIADKNKITVGQTNYYGNWNKFTYDVVLTVGYSTTPVTPPIQIPVDLSLDGISAILLGSTAGIPNWLIAGAVILLVLRR